jgi:hypothetical protein
VSARRVRETEQLAEQSARLVPRSPLDPPRQRPPDPVGEAIARRSRKERAHVEELREIGFSLRSFVKEVVVASEETRWRARLAQQQSRVLQEHSLHLRQLYWGAGRQPRIGRRSAPHGLRSEQFESKPAILAST